MKTIAISFSLRGQQLEDIYPFLKDINESAGPCLLIHGNLPRKEVIKRGLPTDMIDMLDELFPIQLNFWDQKVLREEMGNYAKTLGAEVYIIGDVKDGVKDEENIYKSKGLPIKYLDLSAQSLVH